MSPRRNTVDPSIASNLPAASSSVSNNDLPGMAGNVSRTTYLRRQEARCHQLVPRQRPQGRCRQNARGREPCLLAWRPSSALLTHKTSWSKPGLQQCSKTPSPSRPTRRSLGPKRDLNEVETAGEPEIRTEETMVEMVETGVPTDRPLFHILDKTHRLARLTTTTTHTTVEYWYLAGSLKARPC